MTLERIFFALAVLLGLLAALTLLPFDSLVVSDLGYKTLCPFAPWSTAILAFLAWLAWSVRGYLKSRPV